MNSGYMDRKTQVTLLQEELSAAQTLKRELVAALKHEHRELIDEAMVGGWDRHEQFKACTYCALMARAEKTL